MEVPKGAVDFKGGVATIEALLEYSLLQFHYFGRKFHIEALQGGPVQSL
jgi:hypothetical protein